jgi:hypothetical protein
MHPKILRELDTTFAILGCIGGLGLSAVVLFLFRTMAYRYIEAPFLVFLASVIYLAIRKHPSLTISPLLRLEVKSSIYTVLNILFFGFFSYSLLSLILRSDPYSRPLEYFISTVCMTAVLAVEILFFKKKSHLFLILAKIILITLTLRWIPQLMFPGLMGVDPVWHRWFTMKTMETGYVPDGYSYTHLPIMHLMIGITSSITNLGYKFSTMLSICFLQSISLVFIFLLGRFIYNSKVGLLAALLLAVADIQIEHGLMVRPITLGVLLIPILLYMLMKAKKDQSLILASLSFVIIFVMILTHAIASLCMALLLFSFWIGFETYKKTCHSGSTVPISLRLAIFFTVAMFAWWIYASKFQIWAIGNLIKTDFGIGSGGYMIQTAIPSIAAIVECMLDILGFHLLFAFSSIGSFYILSKKGLNKYSFPFILTGTMLVGITFFFLLSGRVGIQANRWYPTLQVIVAIPAAIGFFLLSGIFKNNLKRVLLLAISISFVSFFMITSPVANMDSPIYSKNTTVRFAYTESEIEAAKMIPTIYDRKIITDEYYSAVYQDVKVSKLTSKQIEWGDYKNLEGLIVIREEIIEAPFYHKGLFKLNHDPCKKLDDLNYNRIYDIGSVTVFYKEIS